MWRNRRRLIRRRRCQNQKTGQQAEHHERHGGQREENHDKLKSIDIKDFSIWFDKFKDLLTSRIRNWE